ncbi:LysR family transcriptional regulator [Roseibium sp.]|uniref:LysR family transcriptional regulator n=1 Tax=Roseibium sp. TaxID=1936156 RepID=UPI003D0EB917
MTRRVSLSAIRVFDAAGSFLSFKKAAAELGMTPTAVSHRIRNLEEDLGCELFRRSHRRIELTRAGQRLHEASKSAIGLIDEAIREIIEETEVFTIATTPAFASLWLAPRMSEFNSAFPGTILRIEADYTAVDLDRVRAIDLAIRYLPRQSTVGQLLAQENFRAFASPQTAGSRGDKCQRVLLTNYWKSRSLDPVSIDPWMTASEISGEGQVIRFDDEQHAALAAISGKGIAVLSDLLAGHFVEADLLVPIQQHVSHPGYSYRILSPDSKSRLALRSKVSEWLLEKTRAFRD